MVETICIASNGLSRLKTNDRYITIKNILQTRDFDTLILRLIFEHDNNHYEYYHQRGQKPKPTNKMFILFNYLFNNECLISYPNYSGVYYNGYFFGIKKFMGKDHVFIKNLEDQKTIFSFFL